MLCKITVSFDSFIQTEEKIKGFVSMRCGVFIWDFGV